VDITRVLRLQIMDFYAHDGLSLDWCICILQMCRQSSHLAHARKERVSLWYSSSRLVCEIKSYTISIYVTNELQTGVDTSKGLTSSVPR